MLLTSLCRDPAIADWNGRSIFAASARCLLAIGEGARPQVMRDNMGHANIGVTQNVYDKHRDSSGTPSTRSSLQLWSVISRLHSWTKTRAGVGNSSRQSQSWFADSPRCHLYFLFALRLLAVIRSTYFSCRNVHFNPTGGNAQRSTASGLA
jgi:hypothetical protein